DVDHVGLRALDGQVEADRTRRGRAVEAEDAAHDVVRPYPGADRATAGARRGRPHHVLAWLEPPDPDPARDRADPDRPRAAPPPGQRFGRWLGLPHRLCLRKVTRHVVLRRASWSHRMWARRRAGSPDRRYR